MFLGPRETRLAPSRPLLASQASQASRAKQAKRREATRTKSPSNKQVGLEKSAYIFPDEGE